MGALGIMGKTALLKAEMNNTPRNLVLLKVDRRERERTYCTLGTSPVLQLIKHQFFQVFIHIEDSLHLQDVKQISKVNVVLRDETPAGLKFCFENSGLVFTHSPKTQNTRW